MWAFISAREEAGAAGAEDRDALKKAALAVLADESTAT